jgi:hypothetical protein
MATDSETLGSIPGATSGSTQPREVNCGAPRMKNGGFGLETRE